MKRWMARLNILLLCGLAGTAWASAYNSTMSILSASIGIIFVLCKLTGLLFSGIAFVRYRQYRQNPSETPLSRVIYVALFGVAMFLIPYMAEQEEIITTIHSAAEQSQYENE